MNVLILAAGTEIGREIWQALRHCKEVSLFLAGADTENHARFCNHDYTNLPAVNQPGWLEALQTYCRRQHIDFISPAHDDVLLALVENRQHLSPTVLAPGLECCKITRSKQATYHMLADIMAVPALYKSEADIPGWPVFIKPDRGQGAQGAVRADDAIDLHCALKNTPGAIICQHLPGEEFTVDCFSDRERGLLFCQPRTRERIRSGIANASTILPLADITPLAEKIAQRLTLFGAWFFQLKRAANGELTLLEVAPRIAGSMAVNRVRGINFPLLTLYESLRQPLSLLPLAGEYRLSRALINRYQPQPDYQHVYVDFDDTLLLKGKLCLPLITLLYQCLNEGKKLYLITRHRGNLAQQLDALRLSTLFDHIIHLTRGEKKSQFIQHFPAIFIDDSFSERQDVSQMCAIPTFDNSMIELLLKE